MRLTLTCVFLLAAAPAFAQVPTVPISLGDAVKTDAKIRELDDLTKSLNAGNWNELQEKARAILKQVPGAPLKSKWVDHFVVLAWAGRDASGTDALLWTLIHDPRPEAYTTILPGLKGTNKALYEIYLSKNEGAGFASYYISTQVNDPLLSEIPAVVQKITGPFFGLVGGAAGTFALRFEPERTTRKTEDTLFAWVRLVPLPMPRADVKAVFLGSEPIDTKAFSARADTLASRLRFNDVSYNPCARDFAQSMAMVSREIAEKSCQPGSDESEKDRKTRAEHCLAEFDTRFMKEFQDKAKSCQATDMAPLRLVNREFRQLVTNWQPEKMKAEVTFKNRPLTHFGFGVLTSFAFTGKTNEPRAKVDKGVLVEDPLPRMLTVVALNYNPWGYNGDSMRIGWRERVNLFGGATIIPEFGLAGGVNFVLVRGLGLNLGGARLYHLTKQAADSFGQPPSDPNDPLRSASFNTWFAGFSYAFK